MIRFFDDSQNCCTIRWTSQSICDYAVDLSITPGWAFT